MAIQGVGVSQCKSGSLDISTAHQICTMLDSLQQFYTSYLVWPPQFLPEIGRSGNMISSLAGAESPGALSDHMTSEGWG